MINFFRYAGISALALLFSACAAAPAPSRSEPQPTIRQPKPEAIYIDLDGSLENAKGEPVDGVTVTAEAPYSVSEDVTNRSGNFHVYALFNHDDTVLFRFYSQSAGVEWTYTLHTIPKGVGRIKLGFVLKDNGSIEHRGTEY